MSMHDNTCCALSNISCMRLTATHVSLGMFHCAVCTLRETTRDELNECGLLVRLEGGKVAISYQLWM